MNSINFTPFPNLSTNRLYLRQLSAADNRAIYDLRNDDSVNAYLDRPKKMGMEQVNEFIERTNSGIESNTWVYWAIILKASNAFIGTICLWNFNEDKSIAEVGYELAPQAQGKGFMREALSEILEYAFAALKLVAVEAYTNIHNHSSNRLLEKFNFVETGQFENSNGMVDLIFTLQNTHHDSF